MALPPHVVEEPQFTRKPTLVLPIAAISDPDNIGPSIIGREHAQQRNHRSRGSRGSRASSMLSDWELPVWSHVPSTGKAVVSAGANFGWYWFNPQLADRSYLMERLRVALEKLPDLLPPSPMNRLRMQKQGGSPLASSTTNRISAFSYVSFEEENTPEIDAGDPMTPRRSMRKTFVEELSELCEMGFGSRRLRDVENMLKPRASVDSVELLRRSHLDDFTIEQLRKGFEKVLSIDPACVGTVEEAMTRHWPFFTLMNIIATALLWFVHAECILCSLSTGGLENVFPGKTLLRVHDGCEDLRAQFWRWLTYQFTHVSLTHMLVNLVLTLVAGVPLEGMHGAPKMALMFNLGVFGGACATVVWDVHSATAGMSGGLYALMGMHLADLIMNWQHKVYRYPILYVLLFMLSLDVIGYVLVSGSGEAIVTGTGVSYATHFGGYVTGVCAGILFGVRLCPRRCDRCLRAAAFIVAGACAAFAAIWGFQWPPRNVWEAAGWCQPAAL